MNILFSVVLLILALAVVMLFAMYGELAARVQAGGGGSSKSTLIPLDEAKLGRSPDRWPTEFGLLSQADVPVGVLVLSASCRSCARVAAQLVAGGETWRGKLLGVVISAASLDRAQEFQAANGLTDFTCYLDDGGEWVTGEFGVQSSPVALIMRSGKLDAAYILDDLDLLKPLIPTTTEAA